MSAYPELNYYFAIIFSTQLQISSFEFINSSAKKHKVSPLFCLQKISCDFCECFFLKKKINTKSETESFGIFFLSLDIEH